MKKSIVILEGPLIIIPGIFGAKRHKLYLFVQINKLLTNAFKPIQLFLINQRKKVTS